MRESIPRTVLILPLFALYHPTIDFNAAQDWSIFRCMILRIFHLLVAPLMLFVSRTQRQNRRGRQIQNGGLEYLQFQNDSFEYFQFGTTVLNIFNFGTTILNTSNLERQSWIFCPFGNDSLDYFVQFRNDNLEYLQFRTTVLNTFNFGTTDLIIYAISERQS